MAFALTAICPSFADDDAHSGHGVAPEAATQNAQQTPVSPADDKTDRAAAALPAIGKAALPQDLSPWGMFQHANTVVKAVMIGLAIASLVTWTVWLVKVSSF